MADIIPLTPKSIVVEPSLAETLAKWKAAFPLLHWSAERTVDDAIEYLNGRRDLNFMVEMERRAFEWACMLYDMVANADEKKRLRKFFREMMARHRGRLAPYYAELHAPLRTRLREHKMFVLCGLDPPDPDERRKGRAA